MLIGNIGTKKFLEIAKNKKCKVIVNNYNLFKYNIEMMTNWLNKYDITVEICVYDNNYSFDTYIDDICIIFSVSFNFTKPFCDNYIIINTEQFTTINTNIDFYSNAMAIWDSMEKSIESMVLSGLINIFYVPILFCCNNHLVFEKNCLNDKTTDVIISENTSRRKEFITLLDNYKITHMSIDYYNNDIFIAL